jgi:hypothetical protein
VPDAISAYLRSNDSSKYLDVIAACTAAGCYEELVKYLLMVRAVALEGSCFLYCSIVLLCALDKQARCSDCQTVGCDLHAQLAFFSA